MAIIDINIGENQKHIDPIDEMLISTAAWPNGLAYILSNFWTWKYIITAIIFNVVTFLVLTVFSWFLATNFSKFIFSRFGSFIRSIVDSVIQNNSNLGNNSEQFVISLILTFAFWLFFIFLIVQFFSGISSVVNAPIYSRLTAKIIAKEIPGIQLPERGIFLEILNALNFEFKKLVFSLGLLVVSFALNLIPFIGPVLYFCLTVLQIVFITGLDVFEPYHSLKNYKFRNRLTLIKDRPYIYWPFLAISGFLGSIPFLNIILIPVSIVGACQLVKKNQPNLS